jgi:bacteriophage protein of unknown function (DUF646)|nr:MAG TPA: putative tail component [Caudoviricetes sp.]
MREEFELNGQRLRIQGLRKTVRALEKTGVAASDLKELMHSIGTTVVTTAARISPRRTGALAASIRAGRGKTKAVVRAGGARVPYAGIIHYGSGDGRYPATEFLPRAIQANTARVLTQLNDGLGKLINDLN